MLAGPLAVAQAETRGVYTISDDVEAERGWGRPPIVQHWLRMIDEALGSTVTIGLSVVLALSVYLGTGGVAGTLAALSAVGVTVWRRAVRVGRFVANVVTLITASLGIGIGATVGWMLGLMLLVIALGCAAREWSWEPWGELLPAGRQAPSIPAAPPGRVPQRLTPTPRGAATQGFRRTQTQPESALRGSGGAGPPPSKQNMSNACQSDNHDGT